MKKKTLIFSMAAALLIAAGAVAQKVKSAPQAVMAALKAKYANAAKVTWEKEDGNYEGNWGGKSGEDMSVLFTPAGKFLEQTEAIATSSLPATAQTYLRSNFGKAKAEEAGKITNASGKVTYKVEIKDKEIMFDQNGTFLSSKKE